MKGLYKFYCDYGRMGDLEGIFVADSNEINNIIGKTVYFGEVLGKHSNIYGEIEEDDIDLLTNDQDFIVKAQEYKLVPTGYNPLSYYEGEDEDSEGEDE